MNKENLALRGLGFLYSVNVILEADLREQIE